MHDFSGRTVIVTGGTGALGNAVVAKLIAAGARCRVPYRDANDAQRHPLRGDPNLTLIEAGNLADEVVVARLYQGVSPLWASIHIAGGFAAGKGADTDRAALQAQLDGNLVSCFLCCRARLCHQQGRRRRAHGGDGAGNGRRRHSRQRGRAFDHGHTGEPQGDAEGGSRRMAVGR